MGAGTLHRFQALVKYLVDEAGVGVAIASFGSYPTIQAYLDKAFPEPDARGAPYFTRANTSTPESVGFPDGCSVPDGKLPQLIALVESYGCERDEVRRERRVRACCAWRTRNSHTAWRRPQVLFFDDDRRNADLAARNRFMSFHVSRAGFNQALWATALADLDRMAEDDAADEAVANSFG